ncbi:MAG: flavin reductase family protein [Dehalococcoidales bacterium]
MTKEIIDSPGGFFQHYPRVAVVITAKSGAKENAMTVCWHMPMSKKPPLIAFVTGTRHFTYKLIKESGEFAVNLLPDTHAELVAAIGGTKGESCDKFATFAIKKGKSAVTSAPVLADAYVSFECKVIEEKLYNEQSMVIGEVVATHMREECFSKDRDTIDIQKVKPVLYLGNEQYLDIESPKVRILKREECAEDLKI